ncbi:exosortase C-terminal domain/associated protein EpsI [Candidatus Auribacterota bacterium]
MQSRKFIILIILLIVTLCLSFLATKTKEVEINFADLSMIPYKIDNWTGKDIKDGTLGDLTERIQATKILYRVYKKPDGPPVTVFVSSCRSLKNNPNFKYHFPIYCYVGSGWTFVKEIDEKINGSDELPPFYARKLFMQKGDNRLAAIFYLITRRSVKLTPGIRQRINDLFNRLIYRRSDLTVVRISVEMRDDDYKTAFYTIEGFIKTFDPYVVKALEKAG